MIKTTVVDEKKGTLPRVEKYRKNNFSTVIDADTKKRLDKLSKAYGMSSKDIIASAIWSIDVAAQVAVPPQIMYGFWQKKPGESFDFPEILITRANKVYIKFRKVKSVIDGLKESRRALILSQSNRENEGL